MIAFLAVFGLSFAPTISHALAHAHGEATFDSVCTTADMQMASTAEGVAPADGGPATALNHLSHCPLCGLVAQAMVSLVELPGPVPPEGLVQVHAARLRHAPQGLLAWPQAQPRAPPPIG